MDDPVERKLAEGRERCAERAWTDADRLFTQVDREAGLGAEDLDRLSTCAYMLGDMDRCLDVLRRAHGAHLSSGDSAAALRCAFWAGIHFAERRDVAQASGWLARAARLLDELGGDRVERGYLLLPRMFELEARAELEAAAAVAREAAAIGRRFGDQDLFALAAHAQGQILVEAGRTRDGLRLLDEAMLVAGTGELSPIVTGLVYCGVVLACQLAHEPGRAREWTAVLSRWCEDQPDLVAFSGRCLVHRAEIKQLDGSWDDALEETRRAEGRSIAAGNIAAAGEALYRRGELYRLRGEYEAAEDAYREASRRAREPQPGLALCRLAQGQTAAALAAIRRALAETGGVAGRLRLLPAAVEIMLAGHELDEARAATKELASLIHPDDGAALAATLAHAQGALALAAGEAAAALPALRRAIGLWHEVGAPYQLARSRELAGLACRALGDGDGAALELEAARETHERLGAGPDLQRLAADRRVAAGANGHGLSDRELQVLRMVARGQTNRAIASELVLSERTIERHVSNIFAKLGVSSRTAATAYAYEHRLL
jgi:DNA-binding CsgD family transcriptional regulator